MSVKIHHATAKKAKGFGISLTLDDGEVVASKGGTELTRGMQGNVVLERAIAKMGGFDKLVESVPGGEPNRFKLTSKGKVAKRRAARDEEPEDEDEDENGDDANDEVDAAEGEAEDEEEPKSVVKKKYKDKYKPHRNTCGDDLRKQIFDHISVPVEGGKKGKRVIDKTKLKRFFNVNGAWDPAYAHLNVGMQSMNCSNRLRAKIRRDGHKVVWA